MSEEPTIIDCEKMETDDEPEVIKEILSENTKDKLSEMKKNDGNALYKSGNYREALPLYSEAIALNPDNSLLYLNRAACYMMLHEPAKALVDCQEAIRRDPSNVKALFREAKCHISLGDAPAALRSLGKAKAIEPQHQDLPKEVRQAEQLQHFIAEGDKAYSKGDFRKCVYCMERALRQSPDGVKFKLLRAECLVYLNRLDEARDVSSDIIRFESSNPDAYFVRGLALYYEDNVDKAFQHFLKVLHLAPDHSKALKVFKMAKNLRTQKEQGNSSFTRGDFQAAHAIYTTALAIDPLNQAINAKLHANRAQCCVKMNRLNEALEDFTKAINLDPKYHKAYLRRAKCHLDLEMYEEAVRDYEHVYQQDKSRENKRLLEQAKRELKLSKRKDYYKILGVPKSASSDEIRKAYRRKALEHHPDRHASASDKQKQDQEKLFKELSEAYGILSDPKKKGRYDNGVELDEQDDAGGFHQDFNAYQMFFGNSFQSAGMGPSEGYQFRFM
ncbi:dnaJ homolog subfamily C member 7 [Galendromus occidentalis]|uniref:DnaJ homolog subfamily C member 7 n=1 Tax=Galendromus occidentalis TaxID=34638 RepID=A0AAJ6VW78_9ACAR|nr:dnaJ homolog subfamily C member 7 [Galendromus occidentalis]